MAKTNTTRKKKKGTGAGIAKYKSKNTGEVESIHSFGFRWQRRRLIDCLFRRRMWSSSMWVALIVLAAVSILSIVWQTVEIGTDLVPPVIMWEPSTITGNNSNFDSMKTVSSKCVHEIITSARMKVNHTFDKPKRRQILYLHPGPAKTATSTIQTLLVRHNNHLNADNIFRLGKAGYPCGFPNPSFPQRNYIHHRDNKRLMKWQLDEYYDHGVDIIMSSEEMGIRFVYMQGHRPLYEIHRDVVRSNDPYYEEFFHDVVRSNDWEIRVLIGYRPYFEFAISGFNQQYKMAEQRPKKIKEWPINGGIRIPLVKSGVLELKSDLVQFPFAQFPFTDELVDFFKPYADRLVVFDITVPNHNYDVTVHFFCDLLEGAENTCLAQKALQASETKDVRGNQAVILDYDRMATAAADRGLMNVTASKLTRAWVGKQIENHMKIKLNGRKLIDLPLVCPTKKDSAALDRLYNVSLAQEMKLFPVRDPDWEVKARFDKMMKENKLCNINVHQLLQNAEWKNFFRSLKQKPLKQKKSK